MEAAGDNKESCFWDLVFLNSDHRWTADNDTDSEDDQEDNPIGNLLEHEGRIKQTKHDSDEEYKAIGGEEEIERKIC